MSLGDLGLWVLVALTLVGSIGPLRRFRSERVVALLGTGLVALLAWQFLTEDWSSAYVVDHTRPGLNPLLRMAGLWAGAEGSLLLWTTFVAWAALLAPLVSAPGAADLARRLGSGLTAGYGLILALTASPFERLALPANGGLGLQPVLEHPAMVWHPPILYAGLVGLLVPSIAAAAAGLSGSRVALDRRSVAVPVGLLTIGLVTGAVWANVELGWGGYWAWDPIESAGLVAWLAGAAALHAGARPPTALMVLPGVAAVGATTVTRIGVVASVHAFADRPALRLGLLLVAGVTILIALASVVRSGRSGGVSGGVFAAAGHRRLAIGALLIATLFVAVGTFEPVIEAATTGDRLAIAGYYYTRLLWPLVVIAAALAVRADRRWVPSVIGAAAGMALIPFAAGPFAVILAAAGGAVGGSAIGAGFRHRRPGAVAHFGVGLALIGVAGTVATTSSMARVPVGEAMIVDGVEIEHRSIELVTGSDTRRAVAAVVVDGVELEPSLITYDLRGVSTAEIGRFWSGLDEIQIVLLDGDANAAQYRLNRLPRVGLVWLGAAVIAAGLVVQPRRRLRARSSDTVVASPVSALPPSSAVGLSGGDFGGSDSDKEPT